MSSKVNAECRGSHICKKSQEIGKCIIPLPITSDPLASGHTAVYRCVSAANTHILINTHPGRQTGGSGCSRFPWRPLGVHSSCPVLTGLEVAVRLRCIVGRMRHVSLGVAHARPTAGRAEKGMGRQRQRERAARVWWCEQSRGLRSEVSCIGKNYREPAAVWISQRLMQDWIKGEEREERGRGGVKADRATKRAISRTEKREERPD